jgi:hypothetical protein
MKMIRLMPLCAAISLVALSGCHQSSVQATNEVSPENPPAQRIPEFENSAFCSKYHCRLETPISVVGPDGKVDRWHYTYRLEGNDLMNVDLSLSARGERKDPYVAVYWRPLKLVETESSTAIATVHTVSHVVHEKEIAPVRDLVNEVVGSDVFDASAYAKKCLLSYTNAKKGINGAIAKNYAFECTYAESNDEKLPEQKMFPQLTLVIAKLPIQQVHQ